MSLRKRAFLAGIINASTHRMIKRTPGSQMKELIHDASYTLTLVSYPKLVSLAGRLDSYLIVGRKLFVGEMSPCPCYQ
jgi:hypothetical protein